MQAQEKSKSVQNLVILYTVGYTSTLDFTKTDKYRDNDSRSLNTISLQIVGFAHK